jgi:hypothetical protein
LPCSSAAEVGFQRKCEWLSPSPSLVAGLLVSLKEITTQKSVNWETVAGALLGVAGSVLLGYQAIADAQKQSILAGVILSAGMIGLAFLVPLSLNFFLRKPNRGSSSGSSPTRRASHIRLTQ